MCNIKPQAVLFHSMHANRNFGTDHMRLLHYLAHTPQTDDLHKQTVLNSQVVSIIVLVQYFLWLGCLWPRAKTNSRQPSSIQSWANSSVLTICGCLISFDFLTEFILLLRIAEGLMVVVRSLLLPPFLLCLLLSSGVQALALMAHKPTVLSCRVWQISMAQCRYFTETTENSSTMAPRTASRFFW
jgi:cytochrome bd-type quinol oxidase subunit 2